ncbi:MAG: hypothetical protein ISQ06_07635 [Planctomycetaceae bacterium]|jgi:hypothetical protein|nr:hypothetical protein [Planctomycetaceae bacterium]
MYTFEAIKMLAAYVGGNAIVGVDIIYTEFSGNRIGLIVNGTFVEVVRESPSSDAGRHTGTRHRLLPCRNGSQVRIPFVPGT